MCPSASCCHSEQCTFLHSHENFDMHNIKKDSASTVNSKSAFQKVREGRQGVEELQTWSQKEDTFNQRTGRTLLHLHMSG